MKKLFCPGPVDVSVDSAELMISMTIGHRSKEFERIFKNVKDLSLKAFGGEKDYLCLPITGSATLGNEMAVGSTLDENDKVLLLTNGVFGDRLKGLLDIYKIPYVEYRAERRFSVDRVRGYLEEGGFSWVLMVHHETSLGILNPIAEVARLAKSHGARIMVDAVSSGGGDKISLRETPVDIMTSTSGKALGSYPGIALVLVGKDAYAYYSEKKRPVSDYMDLYHNIRFSEEHGQTLHTPSTPLFIALESQLRKFCSSPNANYDRYLKMNTCIRSGLKRLGIRQLLDDTVPASVTLTSFTLDPQKYDVRRFIEDMDDRGYVLYIGKGDLERQGVFQVANMGDLAMRDCYNLIDAISREIESGGCRRE